MEDVVTQMSNSYWAGESVFVTGHTGFKGGWLSLWLNALGAKVHGYALNPPSTPNLFAAARIADFLASDTRADLADLRALQESVLKAKPRVIFHLAAQALVRASYSAPLETLDTNILGTAHLLEAVRSSDSVQAVVIITTDKVYDNREWSYPYREIDPLGGFDPYSASKAAAEIITASYRASFFASPNGHKARVATARAGNVIGGGDWATDRLIPDCLKAFTEDRPVSLRYPNAIRPWQHVLEPLAGYLSLAQALLSEKGEQHASAWNFGPATSDECTVGEVATALAAAWGDGADIELGKGRQVHEAGLLRLDSTRAKTLLGWQPRWKLATALKQTVEWHRAWLSGEDMAKVTLRQIEAYTNADD